MDKHAMGMVKIQPSCSALLPELRSSLGPPEHSSRR